MNLAPFLKPGGTDRRSTGVKKNEYNSKDVFKPLLQMQITVHTVKHITGDVKTKTGLIVSCTFLKVQLTIEYQTWFCSFQGLHTTFKIKWKKDYPE